jgi:hypothetical protein
MEGGLIVFKSQIGLETAETIAGHKVHGHSMTYLRPPTDGEHGHDSNTLTHTCLYSRINAKALGTSKDDAMDPESRGVDIVTCRGAKRQPR